MWGEHDQRTVERLCLENTEQWEGKALRFIGYFRAFCCLEVYQF